MLQTAPFLFSVVKPYGKGVPGMESDSNLLVLLIANVDHFSDSLVSDPADSPNSYASVLQESKPNNFHSSCFVSSDHRRQNMVYPPVN